jgi:hypothetical protein
MRPYDYANRQGVEEITWERFAALAAQLTEQIVGSGFQPEIVIGIARAGLIPATTVACALRCELYPVRVSRRIGDAVCYDRPIWRVDVPGTVTGRRVVVIDEIADTGETLQLVAVRALERGAVQVQTGCLVSHFWANPCPDFRALTSDSFVIFPWDRQVYQGGKWQVHPEIAAGLDAQKGHGKPC